MTATTMTVGATGAAPGLERVTSWLLLAFVASLQLSIAAANILLALTLVCWVALLSRERRRPGAPPFFAALLAYAAVSLVSVAFSLNASVSILDSKQLLLFLVVPLVYDLARRDRASTVVDVILAVGAMSAVYGIVVQYGLLQHDSLALRVRGWMSHYMTYSGELMLVLCAAAARLVWGSRDRTWPALVVPALVVAISLTLTRSAWVGMCAGVGLLFVMKDLRLTLLVPAAVAVLYVAAPDGISNRIRSTVDITDGSNRDRLAMAQAGVAMIRDFPLTGVGPDMVGRLYPEYRTPIAVQPNNPHLHNVPLQIAAERGLPALAVWLIFIGVVARGLVRVFRLAEDRTLAAAGLAAVAAMLAAGMFEYNFGDSEFLMLFLVLITLPFAAIRPADDAAATARR